MITATPSQASLYYIHSAVHLYRARELEFSWEGAPVHSSQDTIMVLREDNYVTDKNLYPQISDFSQNISCAV